MTGMEPWKRIQNSWSTALVLLFAPSLDSSTVPSPSSDAVRGSNDVVSVAAGLGGSSCGRSMADVSFYFTIRSCTSPNTATVEARMNSHSVGTPSHCEAKTTTGKDSGK